LREARAAEREDDERSLVQALLEALGDRSRELGGGLGYPSANRLCVHAANVEPCSPGLPRRIADYIIASQRGEIDQMIAWHEEWFGSRELGPVFPEVLGLSESELGMKHGSADEIADADDVDATFAAMMIPPHEGAIAMAVVAEERAEHDEVKNLAAAITEAQEREVGVLEEHASVVHHG